MNFSKIYALGLRHIYLISNSLPRIIDLIYWPTVQIFLWGFISKFFTLNSDYYSNTIGIILTAAILYDFSFVIREKSTRFSCLLFGILLCNSN